MCKLFISSGLFGSCGIAFFRLILEDISDVPPAIRSFHHFLILRTTKIALFFADVPISGYFSSSSSPSLSPSLPAFPLFFFLFSSIYIMIFVSKGNNDSSNSDKRFVSELLLLLCDCSSMFIVVGCVPPVWLITDFTLADCCLCTWFDFTVSCNNSNIISIGVKTFGRSFRNSSCSSFESVFPSLHLRCCFSIK